VVGDEPRASARSRPGSLPTTGTKPGPADGHGGPQRLPARREPRLHPLDQRRAAILSREQGFLDGLKQYPNNPRDRGGWAADPKAATRASTTRTTPSPTPRPSSSAHPEVNVIFAPWRTRRPSASRLPSRALNLENKVKVVTMDLAEGGAPPRCAATADQGRHGPGRVRRWAHAGSDGCSQPPPKRRTSRSSRPTFAVTGSNVKAAWDFMHGPDLPCKPSVCG
jgi:hypothetical protein